MRKVLLIACSSVLIMGFVIFVLEKTHVINLYQIPTSQNKRAKPLTNIDYSPATDSDNASNDQVKKNSLDNNPQTKPLNVTLTRATMDTNAKKMIVRALIEGTNSGSCKLELNQSGKAIELTKQVSIIQQNNVYTCSGFDIPQYELPRVGEWIVRVTINDGNNETSASQNVMVEK